MTNQAKEIWHGILVGFLLALFLLLMADVGRVRTTPHTFEWTYDGTHHVLVVGKE
jgi:hypothetical protein